MSQPRSLEQYLKVGRVKSLTELGEILLANWLVVALATLAVVLLARSVAHVNIRDSLVGPIAIGLLMSGHLLLPLISLKRTSQTEVALCFAAAGLGLLFVAAIVLLATGSWLRVVAFVSVGLFLFGSGAVGLKFVQEETIRFVRSLQTLHFVEPEWLLLLLVVPIIVVLGRKSLSGLGMLRRMSVIGLRCLVVTLLALAIAEPRLKRSSDQLAVIFVIDRSVSVPQDIDPTTIDSSGGVVDRRWQRIRQLVNDAVARRGASHRDDLSGAILFARRPKLVLPPRPVDRLPVPDGNIGLDDTYTDIAAALKLAMASFPEGVRKRIVLISDGNENLGNSEKQAELARKNGVQIDTIALAVGIRNENEIIVQAVETPSRVEKGARLPIRVFVRNAHSSRVVQGTLELVENRNGVERPIPIQNGQGVVDGRKSPARIALQPGTNPFTFRDKADPKEGEEEELSLTYRAVFQPLEPIPGDRVQNNRALAHVIARDRRRVLFLEADGIEAGTFTHQHLIDRLTAAKFEVHSLNIARLPQNRDDLLHFLSNYGCVVIANVPSEMIARDQQEAIRANTHEQGCGLVMIGGPDSYGAGGYQQTPIERALPVDCQIKALSAAGKGGLVLIMHASEMADGNKWQKEIAKLAIQRLAPNDMVGVLYYDLNTKWHIPFVSVGSGKSKLLAALDRMTPGDMPDFDPFLKSAYETLSDPRHGLTTKHIILISDGDPSLGKIGQQALQDMRDDRITCTTVGVATHGAPEAKRLESMAIGRPGETKPPFHNVKDPRQLPAIYIKESRRVSQSFLFEQKFQPKLVVRDGPTDGLPSNLPELHGFIRTTLKPSPLAQMLIEGPNTFDQRFPILATWQYGLGRAAAFTSDARSLPPNKPFWDRDWAESPIYLQVWEQTIAWALRGSESDRLAITTEYREGKVFVVVEARDENNRPITDLIVEAKVSAPGQADEDAKSIEVTFVQRSGGIYEAEFHAEDVGSYVLNVVAKQQVPGWNGRFKSGLPKTTTEKNGRLFLSDGTEVQRLGDGSVVYVDDGKAVVAGQHEKIERQRTAVTVSYSPEYADLESNTPLLKTISRITGGKVFSEEDDELNQLVRGGDLFRSAPDAVRAFRPLWYWLVFAAGFGLLIDVGVRRIAIDAQELRAAGERVWSRLRQVAESKADYFERLRQRKGKSDEAIEREKAERRFEGVSVPHIRPPAGADAPKPATSTPAPAPPEADAEVAEDDYFTKLRKAKKRAPHERDET